MEADHRVFVLARVRQRVNVITCSGVPVFIHHEGRRYESLTTYLGDYNHLLNRRRELAGFELPFFDTFYQGLKDSRLIKETTNAHVVNGMLQFVLTDEGLLENDCCHAVGNWLYTDGANDHIIVLPNVNGRGKLWEQLAFEMKAIEGFSIGPNSK